MLLQLEAAGFAGLAVILAGPVSASLARARWPARSPRAALILWQAVGLGGGLGILTAGLTLAAGSVDNRWLAGITTVPRQWSQLGWSGWSGIGLTATVGAWLVGATIASTVRIVIARRRHRHRLDAVADPVSVRPTDHAALEVRVVDHPRAIAYCLPGLRPRVVLSRGALHTLPDTELAAVLAHEQAHARGRHDLVIQPFVAWAQTFPFLPTAPRAAAAVDLLVEMLADDVALRGCRPDVLESALYRLADEELPADQQGSSDLRHQLAARIVRLSAAAPPLSLAASVLIYGAAAMLVIAPPLILLLS